MWQPFIPVARQALREPREAATTLMSMGLSKDVVWTALALATVLQVSAQYIVFVLIFKVEGFASMPLVDAPLTFLYALLHAWLILRIGALMDGQGAFPEALLLVVFLQFLVLAFGLALLVVGLFFGVGALLPMIGVALWLIWIEVHFINALHGFTSFGKGFGVFVGATLALLVLASVLGGIVGGPPRV